MSEWKEHLGVKWRLEKSGLIRLVWPSGLTALLPGISDEEMKAFIEQAKKQVKDETP